MDELFHPDTAVLEDGDAEQFAGRDRLAFDVCCFCYFEVDRLGDELELEYLLSSQSAVDAAMVRATPERKTARDLRMCSSCVCWS